MNRKQTAPGEWLAAHYDQLFGTMDTPVARAKAKEAFDADPVSFMRPLESHEQEGPALKAGLHSNATALASVKKGLKVSAEGKSAST